MIAIIWTEYSNGGQQGNYRYLFPLYGKTKRKSSFVHTCTLQHLWCVFDAAHNHKKYSVGKIQQEQITSQERKDHYHSELPIVPLSIKLSSGMLSFRTPGKMPSGELNWLKH